MRRSVRLVLGTVALIGLGACAGTATGASKSALITTLPTTPPTLQKSAPAGTTLVVLRYPAVVESDAEVTYRSNYLRTPIGGRANGSIQSQDAQSIADGAIVKSNYFALSLYKELVERLPDHSVLLSPHAVKLAEDGTLTSEPVTQAESVPSVLTIDFAAYSFPDPAKMMSSEPLTFGDLITPLVVIRSDHRAAVPTQGVLLSSRPLVSHAGGRGQTNVSASLASLQDGKFESPATELDFISYISADTVSNLETKPLAAINAENATRIYPIEKIILDREALGQLATDSSGAVDPLEESFSAPLAEQVIAVLNQTDMTKAAMMSRAASISQFDPSLAALTLTGIEDEDFQARIRYTDRLLEAEQRYLSVQSLRIFDGIHNGEMGAQVRDMLTAEYDVLQERRKLARQQNTATALAVLGAVAAGAAASQVGNDGNTNLGELILVNTISNAAIFAASQAFALNRQSAAIGANYLTSIVPALEDQISVQVNLIDSNETITAIRFEDLREKLQGLYSENQRSVENIGTNCGYSHTHEEPAGVWLGECNGGVGSGTGVGVIRYDDGNAAEYYGTAANGQPNGPGFMIRHGELGSTALEGNFVNGEPDGVIKVSRAGQADVLRLYENGKDVGRAPSGQGAPTPFITPAEETPPATENPAPRAALDASGKARG